MESRVKYGQFGVFPVEIGAVVAEMETCEVGISSAGDVRDANVIIQSGLGAIFVILGSCNKIWQYRLGHVVTLGGGGRTEVLLK